MLPLPSAVDVLASSSPTSQVVFGAFSQYGWMEIGVILAVFVVLFIISVFSGAFAGSLGTPYRDQGDGRWHWTKMK